MWYVGRLLRGIGARLHGVCGWIAYRLGCRTSARNHFERVLLLRGADFTAYVHLGRIAFDTGDYAGWRRELDHARRLDPVRFTRLRHPLELFEPRLAGTSFDNTDEVEDFDGTGDRATWRSLRSSGSSSRNSAARHETHDADHDALQSGLDPRGPTPPSRFAAHLPDADAEADPTDASQDHDDCVSADERARFRERGPIAAGEIERCNLDDLLRRLSG